MSKINGIGIGVSYGNSSGTGGLLNSSTFFAPLKTSLILQRGTGGPTWSRATKAWGFNELGYLEELASGCAFFGGARLVRNTVRTTSEDFSNAVWSKSNLTVTGTNVIVCANSTSQQFIYQLSSGTSITTGQVLLCCVRLKYVSGGADFVQVAPGSSGFGTGQYATISLLDGATNVVGCTATVTLVAADTYDFCVRLTATATGAFETWNVCFAGSLAAGRIPNFVGDGIKSFELLRAWSVDVTNYDASYVPEYVSVGVVASPYFGAGIDGAKYFGTDWQGAPIAAANLLGFRREAAATNNILRSRRFHYTVNDTVTTGERWVSPNTVGAELIVNGGFDADTDWAKSSGWTIGSGVATSVAVTDGSIRQTVSGVVPGKTYTVTYTVTRTAGRLTPNLGSTTDNAGTPITASGTYTTTMRCGTTQVLFFFATSAFSGTIDNVSIKESAIQIGDATGLDGIANTATTLTATAADAIILQPISLASAARCASAYVKRRTGTGAISFTQDGGSTWTDITAQINSSTWSRVQITATLANPSVGFKLSTSGDAIDVDCVQNEAGAEATSPIVTTTTTVTRNADSLTYQTAGNIDLATGTMFCELFSPAMSAFPPVFLIGTGSCSLITDEPTSWRFNDSTTTTTIASGLSNIRTGIRKRSASWGGATKAVCGDGVAPTSGAFDGSFGTGVTVDIGSTLNGYMRNVAIWNYQMTDAELQAITS